MAGSIGASVARKYLFIIPGEVIVPAMYTGLPCQLHSTKTTWIGSEQLVDYGQATFFTLNAMLVAHLR
jgi:hypothetical protein